jgi:hypothetical protein
VRVALQGTGAAGAQKLVGYKGSTLPGSAPTCVPVSWRRLRAARAGTPPGRTATPALAPLRAPLSRAGAASAG